MIAKLSILYIHTIANSGEYDIVLPVFISKDFDQFNVQNDALHQHPHESHRVEVLKNNCHCCAANGRCGGSIHTHLCLEGGAYICRRRRRERMVRDDEKQLQHDVNIKRLN